VADAPTRGHGLLELFLARRRAAMANRLLPPTARGGALLDIGCGSHPLFLLQADVTHRYGVDRLVPAAGRSVGGIQLVCHDVAANPELPFDGEAFDAVAMLAVFEHIPPASLHRLLTDIRRVLRPGGRLILTTPAGWTDPILRALVRLRLVSGEEIEEHQQQYDRDGIVRWLERAGFDPGRISTGTFELGMNLWAVAVR
jgi:SAM-dependent methyltransferase